MALLITIDNRPIFLSAAQANALWLVKTGEMNGSKKVKAKIAKIAKWHLNYATAPQSYLDTHKDPRLVKSSKSPQARLPYVD
jgi:hypothetical protein